MFKKLIGVLVGLAMMGMAVPAHAVLLYDNGAVNNGASGPHSFDGPTEQDVAADFTPTSNWSINAATWAGHFLDDTVSSLERRFIRASCKIAEAH